jgi:hypothetical protein
MKLKTEIDRHCIRWEFVPYTKKGTVYNTMGKKGLALELKNGKNSASEHSARQTWRRS